MYVCRMQGCDHCRLLKGYTSFEKTYRHKLGPQWYEYKEKTDSTDSVISRLPTLTANLALTIAKCQGHSEQWKLTSSIIWSEEPVHMEQWSPWTSCVFVWKKDASILKTMSAVDAQCGVTSTMLTYGCHFSLPVVFVFHSVKCVQAG